MVPINYVAVVAAAVASMAVGFLWYGPLFGSMWKRYMGFTGESMKAMKMTPLGATIGGFIGALVMAYVLAHSIEFGMAYTNASGINAGLQGAFWNWLGFVLPITAGAALWEGKPWGLVALNGAQWLVSLLVMGAIIGAWQ
ncbi:DUF1761 domain-containing protein [Candidatus Parcubacteria bacterium]|nr:MAG: DUF1761 domain-containing protein [Candidatus Parcubacteria bacterium]